MLTSVRALTLGGSGLLLWGGAQAATGTPALLTLTGGGLLLGAALLAGQESAHPSPLRSRPQLDLTDDPAAAPILLPLPGGPLTLDPTLPDSALLARLAALAPADFEAFCCLLLEAQGYRQVQITGQSGDGGVDLVAWHGPDLVLAQCKRTRRPVTAPAVRDFAGALAHADAAYGLLLTTSSFTQPAQDWALDKPLELVDGPTLAASTRRHLLDGSVFHTITAKTGGSA